ncbi:hypothetical protein [Stenotrophomonas maltophilia]|uniref:hypothetical protein n=1 Tax=Stenotrophomonas maltophilia TaxID=40324 RepID=UPI00115EBA0F|nr:hypothetical protein [Stenotrophomonas maltophilia]MCU1063966.1 hypothetical protein [Stenotrophomonas maltophilia]
MNVMLKGLLASVVLVVGAGAVDNASAQAVAAAQCEGCSYQQKIEAARSEIDFGGVAVFSLSTGEINSFVIMPDLRIIELPVNPDLADYYAELVYLYQRNGGSLEFKVPIDVIASDMSAASRATLRVQSARASATGHDLPENAYEAISNSSKMNNVHAWMETKFPSFIAGGQSVIRVFNPAVWLGSKSSQVYVRLEFHDKTTVLITYNYDSKMWERIPNSARDGHNNSIPEKREDFAGDGYREYNFQGPPSTDLQNFLVWAHQNGIPVSGPVSHTRFACSSAGGGPVQCVAY